MKKKEEMLYERYLMGENVMLRQWQYWDYVCAEFYLKEKRGKKKEKLAYFTKRHANCRYRNVSQEKLGWEFLSLLVTTARARSPHE